MEDIEPTPEPPSIGHIIAVILELSIVATFIVHRSAIGLILCVAYLYFSATRALFKF